MAQNSELPQLPNEGDKAKKSKLGEAPTGAGARLHSEATKEWAREAEALRHKPLPVHGNDRYEIHHGDCLSDIAYRSLKTDHKKVNPREIAKEEARLRELNGKEFPSLTAHDKKHRNFLADGWKLKIHDGTTKAEDPDGLKTKAPDAPPPPVRLDSHKPHVDAPLPPVRLDSHKSHVDAPPPVHPEHLRRPPAEPDGPSHRDPAKEMGLRNGTAIYDIASHTVTLPDGERLEAHSGLGKNEDNPRSAAERNRGVTPQGTYDLSLRRGLFHGVQALVLNPEDPSKMHGRNGILAHTYMLGPSGQSNGCLVFKDYERFRKAYLQGEIKRIEVI